MLIVFPGGKEWDRWTYRCTTSRGQKRCPGSLASPTLRRLPLTTETSTAALHKRPASARTFSDRAVLRTAIKETHCLHADKKLIQRLQNDDNTYESCIIILYVYSSLQCIMCKENTGCFKKSFTTLKAYKNLYRGHTQGFELSKCSKTHRVLPRIVMVQCDFHW